MSLLNVKTLAVAATLLAMPAAAEDVSMSTSSVPTSAISNQIVTMLGQETSALRRISAERLVALVSPVSRRGTRSAPDTPRFAYTENTISSMPRAHGGPQWQCLSEALYFEARGESLKGLFGVAEVILNRVDSPRFPGTICGVVGQGSNHLHACQFSYKCDGQPERIREPAAYDRVGKVARIMMDGAPRVLTKGATYFHATSVSPSWSRSFVRTARIDQHYFYRDPRYASN